MEVNYLRSLGSKEVPPTKRSTPAESPSTSTIQVEKGCGQVASRCYTLPLQSPFILWGAMLLAFLFALQFCALNEGRSFR